MSIEAFEPEFMPVGVLTAALQELTPRDQRDPDPDLAIEEWLDFAKQLDADTIQLSAALHPSESDVPAEAMLDPVANTLDLREPFTKDRAARVEAAVKASGVRDRGPGLFRQSAPRGSPHPTEEARLHAARLRRCGDAECARGLRLRRSQSRSLDGPEPPRLRAVFRAPAPGGEGPGARVSDRAVPDAGLDRARQRPQQHRLHAGHLDRTASDLRDATASADQLRIHYDPSHAILMGQDTRSIFQVLKRRGLRVPRVGLPREGTGDRLEGRVDVGVRWADRRARRLGGRRAGDGSGRAGERLEQADVALRARASGTARHDPLAYLQNRTVDWLDHQLAARELLDLDVSKTPLIVEHEYGPARVQEKQALLPILKGSIAFTRRIDEAAACMYSLQNEVLPGQDIPVQGVGRQAYRS